MIDINPFRAMDDSEDTKNVGSIKMEIQLVKSTIERLEARLRSLNSQTREVTAIGRNFVGMPSEWYELQAAQRRLNYLHAELAKLEGLESVSGLEEGIKSASATSKDPEPEKDGIRKQVIELFASGSSGYSKQTDIQMMIYMCGYLDSIRHTSEREPTDDEVRAALESAMDLIKKDPTS